MATFRTNDSALTVHSALLARQNKRHPSGPTTYQLQPLKLVTDPDLSGDGAPLRVLVLLIWQVVASH